MDFAANPPLLDFGRACLGYFFWADQYLPLNGCAGAHDTRGLT